MFQKSTTTVFTKCIKNSQILKHLAIVLGILFYGCEDLNEVGADIVNSNYGTLVTDTMKIEGATVLADSVVTSNSNYIFAGRMVDAEIGKLEAESYFQLNNLDSIKNNLPTAMLSKAGYKLLSDSIDKMTLELPYAGTQGNINESQTISIHELNNDVKLDSSKVYYNNYDPTPSVKPAVLGSVTLSKINIYSNTKILDTLYIEIKDKEFKNFIQNLSVQSATMPIAPSKIKNLLTGLAIKTTSNENAAIIKFNRNRLQLKIRRKLTYSYLNAKNETEIGIEYIGINLRADIQSQSGVNINGQQIYSFNCASSTKITGKRTGKLATLVNPKDLIKAENSNNTVFIQEGSGVLAKLSFPTLQNIKKNQTIVISKAELIVEADDNPLGILRTGFLTLLTNKKGIVPVRNKFGLENIFLTGSNPNSFFYGSETQNGAFSKQYIFNITEYINKQLHETDKNEGLFIAPFVKLSNQVSFNTYKNEYVIQDLGARMSIKMNNIKLKLYYSYIK